HLAQDSGFGRHWLDTARKTLHSLSDFCLAQQARAKRARWTADLGSENRPRSCVRISGGSSTRARTELHASSTSSEAVDGGCPLERWSHLAEVSAPVDTVDSGCLPPRNQGLQPSVSMWMPCAPRRGRRWALG